MVITSTVIKILMVRKKLNVELLAIKHWGHLRSQDDKVYLSRNNIGPGISWDPWLLERGPKGPILVADTPLLQYFQGFDLALQIEGQEED